MEPFYYYWSMWFLWILATFIFAKTKSRFYVSVFILTNMMASIHQITAYFTLNAAYVMFFAAAFVYAGSLGMHKRLRHFVIHLTASAAYGFIFLFALYDPVWFIIKPEWAAVILLTVITLSVEGRFPERLCLFVLGMCQGELLYAAVIRNIAGAAAVGDYKWLSGCSAGVILLVGLTTYEQLAARISQKSKKQGKGATKMS
ncbi:hypothetical protein H2N74_11135 [Bacillus velezensis]|uniref:YphA family membrane protein n=1 Tax=Bacillus velezensis TaxID=492670 RepID=UPI0003B070B0|nr:MULTISPECIES: hypothetical protein [Bacillus]AIU82269.1 hypothetical protein NG74_02200 [Bacillus velezensis]ASK58874.1 hypothetical protein CFN60_10985 [Bacillus velezensis]ATD73465.1 hypothetical protein CLI98_00130 [Bacillus velezensis]ATV23234.1 hypothetical protein CS547_11045 [Bacillus sp. Lzh-5]MVZ93590.1 hypothetical protein [Bacillus velezensis]